MKKILSAIFIIFLLQGVSLGIEEQSGELKMSDVKTFTQDGYFGLQLQDGTTVVNPKYKKIIRLGSTSWIVQYKNRFGIMDSNGNYVVEPKYKHADRIFGKYAKLGNGHDFGLYKETGEIIIKPEYSSIDPLFNNLFLTRKNFLYGVCDETGKILIENEFEDIYMPTPNKMRIKYQGDWFEIEQIKTAEQIELPENVRKVKVDDKEFKITYLVANTGIASGYSVVTATDYALKIFSSISPAYEDTIDELMLSKGAETVSIFMKLGWIPKFPFTYAKNYIQHLKNPYNGPLNDVKSDLKKKL